MKNRTLLFGLFGIAVVFVLFSNSAQAHVVGHPAIGPGEYACLGVDQAGACSAVFGSFAAASAGLLDGHNNILCNTQSAANNNSAFLVSGPVYGGFNGTHHFWDLMDVACTRVSDGTDVFHGNYSVVNGGCDTAAGEVFNSSTNQCEVPLVCDGSVTGQTFWRPGNSVGGGDICHESTNCSMTITNKTSIGSSDLVEYSGTGNNCGAEPVVPSEEVSTDNQCINDGGNSWCTETGLADQNCGMYNGEYVCLASVPSGGCTFFGNGDMACDSAAGTPPAPDNGTPGTPAPPDSTLASDDGVSTSTTNIFNSTTVNNSGTGTSGTNQGDAPADPVPAEVDFNEILETPVDPGTGATIDTMTGGLEGEMDAVIAELADPSDFTAPGISLDSTIINSLTGSACSDIVIPFPGGAGGGGSATIGCSDLANLRAVLGWILKVMLAMYFFDAIMTRPK